MKNFKKHIPLQVVFVVEVFYVLLCLYRKMEVVESIDFVAVHVFFLAVGLPIFLLKWKKNVSNCIQMAEFIWYLIFIAIDVFAHVVHVIGLYIIPNTKFDGLGNAVIQLSCLFSVSVISIGQIVSMLGKKK